MLNDGTFWWPHFALDPTVTHNTTQPRRTEIINDERERNAQTFSKIIIIIYVGCHWLSSVECRLLWWWSGFFVHSPFRHYSYPVTGLWATVPCLSIEHFIFQVSCNATPTAHSLRNKSNLIVARGRIHAFMCPAKKCMLLNIIWYFIRLWKILQNFISRFSAAC